MHERVDLRPGRAGMRTRSYEFLKIFSRKILIEFFFSDFLLFCVGSIKECIYVCLGMHIQENMLMNIAAHL